MRNYLLIAVAVLLCSGCGRKTSYRPLDTAGATALTGEILNECLLTQIVPGQHILRGYLAIIYPGIDGKTCHLYTKQGKPLLDFGASGKGPGEVLAPNAIFPGRDSISLWVYDAQLKKLLQWYVDSLLSGNRAPIAEQLLPALPFGIDRIYPAGEMLVAVNGVGILPTDKADRLFLLDSDGRILDRYDAFPPGEDTIRMKSAYRHHAETVSPDGSRMAFGTSFGAIMEIFDLEDNRIRLHNISYVIEPAFSHDKLGNPTSYDDITFGFGPLCSSADRIYAAYNGTRDFGRMNHIAVFDWEGKLRHIYKTDFQLIRTSYDPSLHAIFATVENEGEYQLVRFDLPDEE